MGVKLPMIPTKKHFRRRVTQATSIHSQFGQVACALDRTLQSCKCLRTGPHVDMDLP